MKVREYAESGGTQMGLNCSPLTGNIQMFTFFIFPQTCQILDGKLVPRPQFNVTEEQTTRKTSGERKTREK